jgi:hypothetical protein
VVGAPSVGGWPATAPRQPLALNSNCTTPAVRRLTPALSPVKPPARHCAPVQAGVAPLFPPLALPFPPLALPFPPVALPNYARAAGTPTAPERIGSASGCGAGRCPPCEPREALARTKRYRGHPWPITNDEAGVSLAAGSRERFHPQGHCRAGRELFYVKRGDSRTRCRSVRQLFHVKHRDWSGLCRPGPPIVSRETCSRWHADRER